ncbi:MAG: hypothetical protein KIH01_08240 [Candidatus Freyarchaeota archaeon]|nr:hypothetical protein [Candidatus Jordarchaeia archaeon]
MIVRHASLNNFFNLSSSANIALLSSVIDDVSEEIATPEAGIKAAGGALCAAGGAAGGALCAAGGAAGGALCAAGGAAGGAGFASKGVSFASNNGASAWAAPMNTSKTASGSFLASASISGAAITISSSSAIGTSALLASFSISFWIFLIDVMYELCIFWKLAKYFSDMLTSDLHRFNTALRTFSSFLGKAFPSTYFLFFHSYLKVAFNALFRIFNVGFYI